MFSKPSERQVVRSSDSHHASLSVIRYGRHRYIHSWLCRCFGRGGSGGSCLGRNIAVHTPRRHVVVPTSVVLMGINVERHTQHLTQLNVHLVQPILTKNPEHAFAGIVVKCFDNEFLGFPRRTCTSRSTPTRWQNGNDFSFYFHLERQLK